ncbi:MAG: hypothetical protein KIT84_20080 [Labilithrix sp.]|nr:hypothetical protein [Labilithrix sp.]MCW5813338.1 hypothetical protein [Labilithrix sp.]
MQITTPAPERALEFCSRGGLLVGMGSWLPQADDEPWRRQAKDEPWGEHDEVIGCSRLVCGDCKVRVKTFDCMSFSVAGPLAREELPAIYEGTPLSPPRVTWGTRDRIYLCKCSIAEIGGVKEVGWLDHADGWCCGGHPNARRHVPVVYPSAEVLAAKLAAPTSSLWERLSAYRHPYLLRIGWPAVTLLLVHADARVRERALAFVEAWTVGFPVTSSRLLDLAKRCPPPYDDDDGPDRLALARVLALQAARLEPRRAVIEHALRVLRGDE